MPKGRRRLSALGLRLCHCLRALKTTLPKYVASRAARPKCDGQDAPTQIAWQIALS